MTHLGIRGEPCPLCKHPVEKVRQRIYVDQSDLGYVDNHEHRCTVCPWSEQLD